MTERDYCAAGCTALIDALGDAIRHIARIHHYARPEDVPEHTIFVITTDGMENASHRYSADEVKRMVTHEQEKYGWEFIFLAANIDAVETAAHYGVNASRAVNYMPDAGGTDVMFEAASCAVGMVREHRRLDSSDSWRVKADRDYSSRKK